MPLAPKLRLGMFCVNLATENKHQWSATTTIGDDAWEKVVALAYNWIDMLK